MKTAYKLTFAIAGIATTIAVAFVMANSAASKQETVTAMAGQPALTVDVTRLQSATLPIRVAANGNIMAWQEAIVGAEVGGLRLVDVRVNVGDKVQRGQVLANFVVETVEAELAQSRAAAAEAEAALAEATANARRARALEQSGALSAQQIQQYVTAEHAAQARLDSARATEQVRRLRLTQTQVLAPDDGVISARTATVGAVAPAGQELFRLIRAGRLEWRAEVAAADLPKLKPGYKARLMLPGGDVIDGRLRMVAPSIDIQTRNGLVYVDLPPDGAVRAGMFARGEFELGTHQAMTLPQSAVVLREGFSYVMRLGGDSRIVQTKVTVGTRMGDRIQIINGLDKDDAVVLKGAAFLGDGDLVHVVLNTSGGAR
jgi:RND family efflux transporter MFP subunit